jgi:hypothetical protein
VRAVAKRGRFANRPYEMGVAAEECGAGQGMAAGPGYKQWSGFSAERQQTLPALVHLRL